MDISQSVEEVTFDPIKAMNSIGDSRLDHIAIQEFTFDWTALLTSDLGLSLPAFRGLLMNRSGPMSLFYFISIVVYPTLPDCYI